MQLAYAQHYQRHARLSNTQVELQASQIEASARVERSEMRWANTCMANPTATSLRAASTRWSGLSGSTGPSFSSGRGRPGVRRGWVRAPRRSARLRIAT